MPKIHIKIFGVYETENGKKKLTAVTNFFPLAENVQNHENDVNFWHDKFSCQEIGRTENIYDMPKIEGENFSIINLSCQNFISQYSV